MTAWEVLTGNSSLPIGTAWQHLNAQEGGGPVTLQIFESMECALMADLSAELEPELIADLAENELAAELQPELEAEIE